MGPVGLGKHLRAYAQTVDPRTALEGGTVLGVDGCGVLHNLLAKHAASICNTNDWSGFSAELQRVLARLSGWGHGQLHFLWFFDGVRLAVKTVNQRRLEQQRSALKNLEDLRAQCRDPDSPICRRTWLSSWRTGSPLWRTKQRAL
jgi:hypothetical protein